MLKSEQTGLQNKDEAMTQFRRYYADEAEAFFTPGEVDWPKARGAWWGDTFFNFKGKNLPKASEIVHKADLGFVDLAFRSTEAAVLKELFYKCRDNDGITVVQTGKSASFRFQVDGISNFSNPEAVRPTILVSLGRVRELLSFYAKNKELLSISQPIKHM